MKEFYTRPEITTGQDEMELILMEAPKMPFWKKILIYAAIWIVIILIACGVMWSIMTQYEAAQPERTMDSYIELSKQELFFNSLKFSLPDFDNRYEPLYDTAGRLADIFTDSLSYSKSLKDFTRENPVYIIKHGDEDMFKVTLEHDVSTGFMGFMNYRVKSTELLKKELLELDEYYLVFPQSSIVTINSIQLERKITGNYKEIEIYGTDQYRAIVLGEFLLEPQIKANVYGYSNGMIDFLYSPQIKAENKFRIYTLDGEEFRTLTIDAPESAEVAIGGKAVTDIFLTDTYTVNLPDSGAVRMVEYTVPTVFGDTFVSAYLDGVPLTVTNEDTFYTALPNENTPIIPDVPSTEDPTFSYTVIVPKNATLCFNGTEADKNHITGENVIWHSCFAEMSNAPTADEYTLAGLTEAPTFTASIDGIPLTKYSDEERIVFVYEPSEELKNSYAVPATDFVSRYLHYISQGYRNTEANLDNVLATVLTNSHAYKTLNKTYDGIRYNSPQSMQIESLVADTFIPFDDDIFICKVTYTATFTDSVNNELRENSILVIFERSGNTFKPSKFILE